MMVSTNDFFGTALSIVNVLWPAFALLTGLILGFSIFRIVVSEVRSAYRDDDYSTHEQINRLVKEAAEVKQSLEKRKNDAPEEKEKPTAWQLGDDGEMVPVIPKRKNDDMFHQN